MDHQWTGTTRFFLKNTMPRPAMPCLADEELPEDLRHSIQVSQAMPAPMGFLGIDLEQAAKKLDELRRTLSGADETSTYIGTDESE